MRHNHLIRNGQWLWCYSSGNGCLSLVWNTPRTSENPSVCTGRKVTLTHVRAFLRLKEEQHLVERGWVPAFIEGRWVLARKVQRTGDRFLFIPSEGGTYRYKVSTGGVRGDVNHTNFTAEFRIGRKWYELKNLSTLMVLRYFLNHEKELTPIFGKETNEVQVSND